MAPPQARPWVKTPLVESNVLSQAAGCRIFLKLENLQPSGSFKSRGIGYYMQRQLAEASDASRVHFYCSSGGNAGLACVHAARFLGRPSTVAVPMTTKPMMLAKIRAAGASDVVQHGATFGHADIYLREVVIPEAIAKGEIPIYVPPFDHPDIWAGHETLVYEVEEQLLSMSGYSSPDALVCSVGGGGLLAGILNGIQTTEWSDTKVLAMGTEGASALHQSLEAGERVTLPGITSIATSLGATKVCEKVFDLASTDSRVKSVVLSDAEAAMGIWRLADDEKIMVEPACGVNAAMCYGGRLSKALGRQVQPDDMVVIVICGGSGVNVDMISEWRRQYSDQVEAPRPKEKAVLPSAAVHYPVQPVQPVIHPTMQSTAIYLAVN